MRELVLRHCEYQLIMLRLFVLFFRLERDISCQEQADTLVLRKRNMKQAVPANKGFSVSAGTYCIYKSEGSLRTAACIHMTSSLLVLFSKQCILLGL